ncbi:helix-turn-helix domain-containing protein [Mesorhizobium sp. CO1-1-8]|uniref:helix-turn-helix domain-containing protein n=1 Tax=Mesorhizobium sp. CO1-1-8 TaxID=2876631 RepID=UPI001CD091E0|nr:helix-turn-helix transcriptional regulator [Mesorhizobium sp. CO1-1-8]MBZ9771461.1 helix-turn-helix domain-containing protein [Mesorhizobium sp. CO1-1-8]
MNKRSSTVSGIQPLTSQQCRSARAILKWSQVRLAAKCGLSEGTIGSFESGRRIPSPAKLAAIRRGFEAAGVVFIDQKAAVTRSGPPRETISGT